jgi:hypothetical protein
VATPTTTVTVHNPEGLTLDDLGDFAIRCLRAGATGAEPFKSVATWRDQRVTKLTAEIAGQPDDSGQLTDAVRETQLRARLADGPHRGPGERVMEEPIGDEMTGLRWPREDRG